MNIRSFLLAVVAYSAVHLSGPAAATIVNVDARNETGISVNFGSGDYLVSWIGIANGGSYDAWQAWGGSGWFNALVITTTSGSALYGTGVGPYATPGEALAAAQSLTFHMILANAETVNFVVGDAPGWYFDNNYGVSLSVTDVISSVPEPGAYAMVLAGLGLMGFVARRRKQKQTASSRSAATTQTPLRRGLLL